MREELKEIGNDLIKRFMKHKRSLNFNQLTRKTNKYRNSCRRLKKYSEEIFICL